MKGGQKPSKPVTEEKKPAAKANFNPEDKKYEGVVILYNSKEPKIREMDLGAWNDNLPKKEEKSKHLKAMKRVSFSEPIVKEEEKSKALSEKVNGEVKQKPIKESLKKENGASGKQEKQDKNGKAKNGAKAKVIKEKKPQIDLDRNLQALLRTINNPNAKKFKEFIELPYKEVKVKREEYVKGWRDTLLKIIKSELDYSSANRSYSGRELRVKLTKIPSSFCSLVLEGRFYQIYNGLWEGHEAYLCVTNFKTEGVAKEIRRFCKRIGEDVLFIDRNYSDEENIWITIRNIGKDLNPFKYPQALDKLEVDLSLDMLKRDLDWYEDRKIVCSAALVQKKINMDNVYADTDLNEFADHEVQYIIAKRLNLFYNMYEHGSVEKSHIFKLRFLNIPNGGEIKKWLELGNFKSDIIPGDTFKNGLDIRLSLNVEINKGIGRLELENESK